MYNAVPRNGECTIQLEDFLTKSLDFKKKQKSSRKNGSAGRETEVGEQSMI